MIIDLTSNEVVSVSGGVEFSPFCVCAFAVAGAILTKGLGMNNALLLFCGGLAYGVSSFVGVCSISPSDPKWLATLKEKTIGVMTLGAMFIVGRYFGISITTSASSLLPKK